MKETAELPLGILRGLLEPAQTLRLRPEACTL